MRTTTESSTWLEMRRQVNETSWQIWCKPTAGMFRSAEVLADQCRISEAIQAAEEIQVNNYGNMFGIQFRCVTKSKTVHEL